VPEERSSNAKEKTLKEQGVLNRHPERVSDALFQKGGFLDRRDLVQVKYEMIRRVRLDKQPVTGTAASFGFSRPSFYEAQRGFEREGLAGLITKKRGPRGGHKFTEEVVDFLEKAAASDPSLRSLELAQRVKERFGIAVHPRSIERALARREKKRRRTA
jgi:transposase